MSTDKTLASKATRFTFLGLTGAALAVAALLSGCNKKERAAPAPAASQPSASSDVKSDAQKVADETKKVATEAKDAAVKAGEEAKEAVEKAADKVGDEAKKAADKVGDEAKKAADAAKDAVTPKN